MAGQFYQRLRPGLGELPPALWLIPAAKFLLHLATSSGYGYFRDELYYLACAEHLDWGYVDQPPLSIAVLAVVRALFGDSLLALRLVPALAGAAMVFLVGVMARRLGGGSFAMTTAMLAALVAPMLLALGHYYSMNSLDLLFWALAAWLFLRLLDDPPVPAARSLWLLLGAVLGLGLLNKISVLWLGLGILVGLLATPARRQLLRPWPWIAGALAAALFLPHGWWQVQHDWPTLEFMRNATGEKMADVTIASFLRSQFEAMNPFTLPISLGGFAYLLAGGAGRRRRALGHVFLTVLLLLAFSGTARASYLAPAYSLVFPAGGVAWERVRLGERWRWLRAASVAVLIASGLLFLPFGIPVLPVERYVAYAAAFGIEPDTEERKEVAALPQFYADMHGWPQVAAALADAWEALPADQRAQAVVFGQNYGVAGAVDFFGRRRGLPPALSGHNNYWLWGPRGASGEVVIVQGDDEETLRSIFTSVERVGTIRCGYCMPYEDEQPIWVGRGIRLPLADLWPRVKHYD